MGGMKATRVMRVTKINKAHTNTHTHTQRESIIRERETEREREHTNTLMIESSASRDVHPRGGWGQLFLLARALAS
mgnify:CR=1 FL=1